MSQLKNLILNAPDRPSKPVAVPLWDCTVYVRTMSGAEREQWEKVAYGADGKPTSDAGLFRASLLVRSLVDAENNRIFADSDAAALAGKSALALVDLFNEAAKANGLAGNAEEVKNS